MFLQINKTVFLKQCLQEQPCVRLLNTCIIILTGGRGQANTSKSLTHHYTCIPNIQENVMCHAHRYSSHFRLFMESKKVLHGFD